MIPASIQPVYHISTNATPAQHSTSSLPSTLIPFLSAIPIAPPAEHAHPAHTHTHTHIHTFLDTQTRNTALRTQSHSYYTAHPPPFHTTPSSRLPHLQRTACATKKKPRLCLSQGVEQSSERTVNVEEQGIRSSPTLQQKKKVSTAYHSFFFAYESCYFIVLCKCPFRLEPLVPHPPCCPIVPEGYQKRKQSHSTPFLSLPPPRSICCFCYSFVNNKSKQKTGLLSTLCPSPSISLFFSGMHA